MALMAGSFGLVPVMLQWFATISQRRDRSTRLNNLRTELDFLERLSAVHETTGVEDGLTPQQTKLKIYNAVSDLLEQYSALPKDVRPTAGADRRSVERRTLFRRVFLLYTPETMLGWVLHSIFYVLLIVILTLLISGFFNPPTDNETGANEFGYLLIGLVIIFALPLLILHRLARRQAARPEASAPHVADQSEPPDSP